MLQVHYTGRFYKGLTREMQSPSHHTKITYEIGKTYEADKFSVSDEACAGGIHIVTSIAHALKWGPVVVEVEVPEDADVVWSADKLRTPKITVVGISDLTWANLTGANLYRASLVGADLTWADLTRADLVGANLTWADLVGADLARANLTRANLTGADLYRANLTGADLTRANLTGGADLTGANLTGADLTGAYLVGADLTGAYGLPTSGEPKGWELVEGFWAKR